MSDWEKEGSLDTKEKVRLKKPSLYRVIMLNDDYTTMDFVVAVLMEVFQKSGDEAIAIMFDVHQKGSGTCGFFPKEIAETKIELVHNKAVSAGYPLRCTMEKS